MHPGHFAVVFGSGRGACQDGGLPAFIPEKYFTKGRHPLKNLFCEKVFIVNDPKNSKKINFHKSHRGGLRFMKLFRKIDFFKRIIT